MEWGVDSDAALRAVLARVAPGTDLRDGLERILRGRTGGLIVLGDDKRVESLCSGGFLIDTEFSATRLRELAKMDGALVLDEAATRIVRANVHLVPDSAIPSGESGTRHRTADRVSKQTSHPVISVSQSMQIIALYLNGRRHVLQDSTAVLSRANQAIATLERYKKRLDEVSGWLSSAEIQDLVTVRDVATVAQRMEMVRRIGDEVSLYAVELGTEGRLLTMQLDELVAGVETDRHLVIRDYLPPGGKKTRQASDVLADLDALERVDLLDLPTVGRVIGFTGGLEGLDYPVSPRGYRLLAKIPRLPEPIVERLVEHFGGLLKLVNAGVDDLQAVEGVGDARARSVREGLSRLAAVSALDPMF